jgi:hypothetical protein
MAISTNNVICPIYFTQMVKPSINPTNIKGTQNQIKEKSKSSDM